MVKPHILTLAAAFFLTSSLHAAELRLGPEVPAAAVQEVGEEQVDPQVAIGPSGTFTVWSDRQRYEVLGSLNGVQFTIDHTDDKDWIGWPAVAVGSRGFLVVWRHDLDTDKDRVLARRFDLSGQPNDSQPIVLDESVPKRDRRHPAPSIAFD